MESWSMVSSPSRAPVIRLLAGLFAVVCGGPVTGAWARSAAGTFTVSARVQSSVTMGTTTLAADVARMESFAVEDAERMVGSLRLRCSDERPARLSLCEATPAAAAAGRAAPPLCTPGDLRTWAIECTRGGSARPRQLATPGSERLDSAPTETVEVAEEGRARAVVVTLAL